MAILATKLKMPDQSLNKIIATHIFNDVLRISYLFRVVNLFYPSSNNLLICPSFVISIVYQTSGITHVGFPVPIVGIVLVRWYYISNRTV